MNLKKLDQEIKKDYPKGSKEYKAFHEESMQVARLAKQIEKTVADFLDKERDKEGEISVYIDDMLIAFAQATAEVITSLHNYKERKFADFYIKEAFPVAMQIAELMKDMEQNG